MSVTSFIQKKETNHLNVIFVNLPETQHRKRESEKWHKKTNSNSTKVDHNHGKYTNTKYENTYFRQIFVCFSFHCLCVLCIIIVALTPIASIELGIGKNWSVPLVVGIENFCNWFSAFIYRFLFRSSFYGFCCSFGCLFSTNAKKEMWSAFVSIQHRAHKKNKRKNVTGRKYKQNIEQSDFLGIESNFIKWSKVNKPQRMVENWWEYTRTTKN